MGLGNENIALIKKLGGKTGECISTNEAILCAEIERLQKIEDAAKAIADNAEEVEFNDGMGFAADLDYLSCLNGALDGAACERLIADGHTEHCVARHIWGDGECECKKQGIIPGAISQTIAELV